MTSAPDPGSFRIVGYGDRAWNPATREPIGPIDATTAEARHAAGEPYAVLLTAAPQGLDLPLATVTLNANGVTVGFHRHDVGQSDQAHMWRTGGDDLLRPVQLDRRAGNPDVLPREQIVYEYLKLAMAPAVWVRMTDGGMEKLGTAEVDLDAVAQGPPAFGAYEGFLDVTLPDRLWPGRPALAWVGPDRPVAG